MIRPIKVAPLSDVRMISDVPIIPNTMTQDEYLRNQFANLGSAPITPNMAARPVLPAPVPNVAPSSSLLGGSAGDMEGVTFQQPTISQSGLLNVGGTQAPQERTAKTISQRVSGLLNNPEGGAALQGALATLTAMGRPVRRGESRVLGAVDYGRKVYGEERDRALQEQLGQAKMLQALAANKSDNFRPLTAEEKKAIGISEFQPAQVNLTTGEIDTFGGGLNYQGTLEQGTELFRTPEGGIGVRPIAGSGAEQEQLAEKQAQESRLFGAGSNYRRTRDLVNVTTEVLRDPNFFTTGIAGALFGALGGPFKAGSQRKALENAYVTLASNVGFDRLQQMRDESPTGGALGQVAIQELQALQASIAKLDPDAKEEDQIIALNKIMTQYEDALLKMAKDTRAKDSDWDDDTLKRMGVYNDIQGILFDRSMKKFAEEANMPVQQFTRAYESMSDEEKAEFKLMTIDNVFGVK